MQKAVKTITVYLGLALVFYQFFIGWFGTPPGMKHRPITVGIILFILFLTVNYKGERGNPPPWYDCLLAVASLTVCLYTFSIYDWFIYRLPYVTPLSAVEIGMGSLLVLLILEATRRIMGWVMPAIAAIGICYAMFGKNLPGALGHRGFSLNDVVEHLFLSTDGIWGSPIHTSSTVVFMFVIFSAALASTGMGNFFMDFSLCIAGRFSGGTAKTAVVSSGLMGMIQGSSVTNVLTTGTFTIPAIKKQGFPDYFAGAVETVASCGGQIMPPVMGAAAFIMADMTGIPYSQILVHAIVPAILYYLCCMMQVHFRSKKMRMKGLPKEELPKMWPLLKKQGFFVLPIFIMVYLLLKGYTAMRAGFMSTCSLLVIGLLFAKERKGMLKSLWEELKTVAEIMSSIIPAVATAGIIVGTLFMTGLGERLSAAVVSASMGYLGLGLILTMIAAIILGMGMPTSAAYILLGSLIAPGLVRLGLTTIQAHMFVFYFACMSMLTPPVAIAAYAAAGIAKSNPNKTGYAAFKLALAAFIVPFMFAYGEELLLIGPALQIIIPVITGCIGCICLAAALEGYIIEKANILQRLMLAAAAILMIETSLITDAIGLVLAGLVLFMQMLKRRQQACA